MQTVLKMPIVSDIKPISRPSLNLEHVAYIEDTIQLLCEISQHSHACFILRHQEQQKLKQLWGSQAVFYDVQFDSLNQLGAIQHVSNHALAHQILKQNLKHQFSSASILIFKSIELDEEIIIVLFSEKEHHISDTTWSCLEQYVQQREIALEQIVNNSRLRQQIEDYEQLSISRAKYFSVISHDLRAPFHGIMGCADILVQEQETLASDAILRLSEYIHDTAQSTYGLLESLLNWSMAEGGRFHGKPVYFNVGDIVQSVFDLLCAFAYKKQIKLQCDIPTNLHAYADVRMVTSILQNLVSNALKFTSENADKKIQIIAQHNQHWVEIIVHDQGVGMTPSQIDKLFQSHTIPSTQGTSGEKGTGLGLVLCKKFLEMNQGEIAVESKQNEGTRFIVRLPAVDGTI